MASESNGAVIRVSFSTNEPDLELREECRQLYVPAETKRYGLSRILNSQSMLDTPAPVPLDFLINGEFLKGSLADHAAAAGLNAEETSIDVVYVRALVPPRFDRSFEHPEWVSAVDVLSETSPAARWWPGKYNPSSDDDGRILSASFDGLLRMWTPDGKCIATSPSAAEGGHLLFAKAAKFLSPTRVASGGTDRLVRIWKYSENDASGEAAGEFKLSLVLPGHKHQVVALEARGDKGRFLTGDSGGWVGLWTSSKDSAPPAPEDPSSLRSAKRRKVAFNAPVRGALSLTQHHHGRAVATFDSSDSTVAYSGGYYDHLVRTLDLTTDASVSSIPLNASVSAVCSLAGSMHPLVAAGTAMRRVMLVDPREGGSAKTSVLTLKGHMNEISSLAQSPSNNYTLASASHDGAIMVWDLRSSGSSAVYVIDRETLGGKKRPVAGEGVQVFDAVWDQKWGIISGSEDRKVQINRWD